MWIATTKNNTSGTGQYNYAILLIPSDCQPNLDHLEPSKVRTGSPSVSFNAWSVSCHRLRHCWVWDSEVDLGDCGLRIAACSTGRYVIPAPGQWSTGHHKQATALLVLGPSELSLALVCRDNESWDEAGKDVCACPSVCGMSLVPPQSRPPLRRSSSVTKTEARPLRGPGDAEKRWQAVQDEAGRGRTR